MCVCVCVYKTVVAKHWIWAVQVYFLVHQYVCILWAELLPINMYFLTWWFLLCNIMKHQWNLNDIAIKHIWSVLAALHQFYYKNWIRTDLCCCSLGEQKTCFITPGGVLWNGYTSHCNFIYTSQIQLWKIFTSSFECLAALHHMWNVQIIKFWRS